MVQAEGAVAKSKEAKEKAAVVVVKAKSVAETSKQAIEVARRQRKCKEVTIRATEKALRTFRSALFYPPMYPPASLPTTLLPLSLIHI